MEKIVAKLTKALAHVHKAWREEMLEDLNLKIKYGYKLYEISEWALREQKLPVTPYMVYARDAYFFARPEGKDFSGNDILVTDFGEKVVCSLNGTVLPLDLDDPLW